ncbi:MAG: serine/threonine-protein phosphatase [Rubrivivax sp.]|nr:serine/threonine-protein phosphatase [Rubrivivax sp.]
MNDALPTDPEATRFGGVVEPAAQPTPATDSGARKIELAVMSHRGGRSYNEDACGHWHSEQRLCCVVADGAGGHGGGDVASKLVVSHIIDQASSAPLARADEVHDLLLDTNAQLRRHQSESEQTRDMHSTVVALFVDMAHQEALWGHAGDSRLYLFREGQMLLHTRDHSVVQSLVDAGMLGPEQIRTHPRRSELQSALGSRPEHLLVSTASTPWQLRGGDAFLLCTDGLWEYVDEAEMCASLARAADPTAWLASLEELVLLHANASGKTAHDNFSGIAVWIGRR